MTGHVGRNPIDRNGAFIGSVIDFNGRAAKKLHRLTVRRRALLWIRVYLLLWTGKYVQMCGAGYATSLSRVRVVSDRVRASKSQKQLGGKRFLRSLSECETAEC